MIPDISLVIELQSLDQRIGEVEREIAALPRHIARIEKTLESHIRKLEADEAALAANQKDRKRLEGEIQVQEQKRSKLRDQMMEAKTNEQYWAFQHEIDFCNQAIRKCEDRILELMVASEPLELNVKAARTALEVEKQQVEKEQHLTRERTAADQVMLAGFQDNRSHAVSTLHPTVYAAYERLRKRKATLAVADATDARCASCHITLRPQFYQDLKKGDKVMFCESCGAMVYYNPAVTFDQELAELPSGSQPAA